MFLIANFKITAVLQGDVPKMFSHFLVCLQCTLKVLLRKTLQFLGHFPNDLQKPPPSSSWYLFLQKALAELETWFGK